jgi:hypothetical protein
MTTGTLRTFCEQAADDFRWYRTWAFVLRPLDEGRRTRLITRMHYHLPFGIHLLYWPLFEVVDLVLQPRMLRAIRARAEGRVRPITRDVSSSP